MNLARIEYYFSEFLSRLEVRRDIHRTDNGTDRAKAEILLDVGRLREEVGCRIFVDTNVLFVGTMNEDESTLTLSDKVVDRANVMRFGRPLSLSRQQRNGQKPEMFRTKAFLSKTQWEGWLRKEEKWLGKEAVEQWISELNEALGQIGRPFGYRTRNAICSYVQQYPESPDRVRQAFADQIEQRVLPKLRGVDIQEDAGRRCLEIVQDVVGKAGDQELRAAIEEGARGHLFTWSGVDRSDETL
jgi:5-methylcytosine-specific restriction endonuclease McrBC GTP-binding regulatory subunit McrB